MNTDKNTVQQSLHFSSICSKKVEADFDGGKVTSDAGVLLLRETEAASEYHFHDHFRYSRLA